MNIKKIYGAWLSALTAVFGVDTAKKFDARFRMHRSLNLKNPQTLADKVSYIELHDQSPLAPMCTDKYAVRDYVAQKGYAKALVPLVGGPWSSLDEVNFDILPDSFALKATHGCKMNFIVPDKKTMNLEKCQAEMKRWMTTTYGKYSMELHYTQIPHRMYAETFLGDMARLTDYKFHCLNGIPQFVIAITGRESNGDKAMKATIDLFDMQWNPIFEVTGDGSEVAGTGNVPKPEHFEEMVEMAKRLSEDFKFVRVDLYEKDEQVFFGELTFTPAACVFPYLSDKFVADMGKKLRI